MRLLYKLVLAAIVALVFLFCIPETPAGRAYRDAASPAKLSGDALMTPGLVIDYTDPGVEAHPLFAIRNGRLYLECQSTRHALVLTTFVSFTEWTASSIVAFRRTHPELEGLWPNSSRPDGGVAWLRPQGSRGRGDTCTN